MLNLIKLELRKNKISSYLLASLCIFVMGLGFCFLFAYAPQIEKISGDIPTPVDLEIFMQWSTFTMLVSMCFAMCFAILSAVMHTKFTIEEYTGKRAILLFSYPQSRSKILFVKCGFVFVFTAVGHVICNVVVVLLFALISNTFGILPTQFEMDMMPSIITMSGVCGLLASSIGLVAMRVGFWKKSLVATVVAAVLLVAPFGNVISIFPGQSKIIHLIGMAVILAVGLLIFMGLLKKVNNMEVL